MVNLRATDGTRCYIIAPLSCQGGQQKATVSSALWQMGDGKRDSGTCSRRGNRIFPLQERDGSTEAGIVIRLVHLLKVSYHLYTAIHPKPLEDKTEPELEFLNGGRRGGKKQNKKQKKGHDCF